MKPASEPPAIYTAISKLPKAKILTMARTRCSAHGRSYLEHHRCWLREGSTATDVAAPERLAVLDIEASNLSGDYGIVLSVAVLDLQTNKIWESWITPEDIQAGHEDKRILQELVEHLKNYTGIVTYFGSKYDSPFLKTRAMVNGIDFPDHTSGLKHMDLYFIVRRNFSLSRRSLENSCRHLLGKTTKNHIDAKSWRDGLRGSPKAVAYIRDHCRRDVRDTAALYRRIIRFKKSAATSI